MASPPFGPDIVFLKFQAMKLPIPITSTTLRSKPRLWLLLLEAHKWFLMVFAFLAAIQCFASCFYVLGWLDSMAQWPLLTDVDSGAVDGALNSLTDEQGPH